MVIISGLYWMKCAFLFRFLLVENREKENRQNRNRERERERDFTLFQTLLLFVVR